MFARGRILLLSSTTREPDAIFHIASYIPTKARPAEMTDPTYE